MILISHRGNVNGSSPERENSTDYILKAMEKYDVEIDLWFVDGLFKLGHDRPQYDTQYSFLVEHSEKLWIHCKNIPSFRELSVMDPKGNVLNYFMHDSDDVVFTSKGYRWALVGNQPIEGSIAVMPGIHGEDISLCMGVCSDYIERYQ